MDVTFMEGRQSPLFKKGYERGRGERIFTRGKGRGKGYFAGDCKKGKKEVHSSLAVQEGGKGKKKRFTRQSRKGGPGGRDLIILPARKKEKREKKGSLKGGNKGECGVKVNSLIREGR